MRRVLAIALGALLLSACPPSLDFQVVGGPGPSDAGAQREASVPPGTDASAGMDASTGADAGHGSGALLASGDCASLLASTVLDEDFNSSTTQFQELSGSAHVAGGDLVLEAPSDYSLFQSSSSFRDVMSCSYLAFGRTSAMEDMGLGLRGPMSGINVQLSASDGHVRLISLEPTTNVVLADETLSTWTSGEHEFVVLAYLSGTRAYAEVEDLTTNEILVLTGTYGGDQLPENATLEGSSLAQPVRVHRVVVGTPTGAALSVLSGP